MDKIRLSVKLFNIPEAVFACYDIYLAKVYVQYYAFFVPKINVFSKALKIRLKIVEIISKISL